MRISEWGKEPCCFLGNFLFPICILSHCDGHFHLLRHVLRVEIDDTFLALVTYCSLQFYCERLSFEIHEFYCERLSFEIHEFYCERLS
jgi:hypothetical protein